MKDSENPNLWYCDGCHKYHSNSYSFDQCEEGHSYCHEYDHSIKTFDDDDDIDEYNIRKHDCPACIAIALRKLDPLNPSRCTLCEDKDNDVRKSENGEEWGCICGFR